MPTIAEAINSLEDEIDATLARQAEISAAGAAATSQLAEITAAVAELQQALRKANELKARVEARRTEANVLINAYFGAIEPVRSAVTSGPLDQAHLDAEIEAIRADLGLADAAAVRALLDVVSAYDAETATLVSDARAASQSAEADLASARSAYETATANVEQAETGLRRLAKEAAATAAAAQSKLKAAADARDADEDYTAVVHLQDLRALRERLNANVSLAPGNLRFDAGRTNETQLTNSVRSAWNTAFDAYQDAAGALFQAEVAASEARLALARASAQAAVRKASRLSAAAEAVRAAHEST